MMSKFEINPTKSKRYLAKQIMNIIDKELLKCSPNKILTLDIKIIESDKEFVVEPISKWNWRKMLKRESRR